MWSARSTFQIRENVLLATQSFFGRSASLGVRRQAHNALVADYAMDNGVPYLRTPRFTIVLVDQTPRASIDPVKPIRSAAFAGLVLTASSSVDEVERIAEVLDRDAATRR